MNDKPMEEDLQMHTLARMHALEAVMGEVLYEIGVLGQQTPGSERRACEFFERAYARVDRDMRAGKGPDDTQKAVKRLLTFMRAEFESVLESFDRSKP